MSHADTQTQGGVQSGWAAFEDNETLLAWPTTIHTTTHSHYPRPRQLLCVTLFTTSEKTCKHVSTILRRFTLVSYRSLTVERERASTRVCCVSSQFTLVVSRA